MLSAYLDESGTHQASRICAIGGLVATPAQWQRLSSAWERVLADVGMSDFHASDCATGGGAFRGWDKKDRESLYSRLVKLCVRMAAFRVWTAVVMDDFHQIFLDPKEKFPYTLCALGCSSRLRWIAMKRGPDLRIPYIFDQGDKGKRFYAQFERLAKRRRDGEFYRIGPLTKGGRILMPPLQAADLHAYEVYRYFSDQMEYGRNAARGSFTELLKISDGGGYLLTGHKLEVLTHEVLRQRLANVTEPIDIAVDRLDTERGLKLRPALPPEEEEMHG